MRTRRRSRVTTTIVTVNKIFWHYVRHDTTRINNAIYDGFNDLGGVYVKFLQILSMRSDLFNDVETEKLLAVYDDVDADDIDLDFVLDHELGDKINYFKTIEREPFAAGSFGQVYRASLHDDRQVIIKVLRPSLMLNLKTDLRLLRFLSSILKFVKPVAIYDINSIFKDFRKVVTEETDYIKEAHHANQFFERYKNHEHITIPQTYLELSTKYLITQDFLEGVPLTKLIEYKEKGVDVEAFVREEYGGDLQLLIWEFGRDIFHNALTADIIQGDPHAGNIKIMPGNRIGIMDFGITAPPPEDRKSFYLLMKNYINMYHGDIDMGRFFMDALKFMSLELYQAINTFNRLYTMRGSDSDAESDEGAFDLNKEIVKVAEKAFAESSDTVDFRQMLLNGQISAIFEQVLNEDNRFGLTVTFDGGVLIRAIATYMSIVRGLDYSEKFIPAIYEQAVKDIETSGVQLASKPDTMDINRAVEIISKWIEDITERDPFLFRELIIKMRKRLRSSKDEI